MYQLGTAGRTKMKPTLFPIGAIVPVLLAASVSDPASDCGTAGTVLKVLAAVLVSGVFVYNHFRGRIRGFLGGLTSRGRRD